MAMIECKNCGKQVSDKAAVCPGCGTRLVEEVVEEIALMICEECGEAIPEGADTCPKCGCPAPTPERLAERAAKEAEAAAKKEKNRKKKLLVAAAAVVLLVVGFVTVKNNVLTGDDKIAYELLVDAADNFKNPSSVQLVSGTLSTDKDSMFAGISATNGYGARSTGYYFVMGGWILEEEDSVSSLYKAKDDLNIKLINKKLTEALGGE